MKMRKNCDLGNMKLTCFINKGEPASKVIESVEDIEVDGGLRGIVLYVGELESESADQDKDYG